MIKFTKLHGTGNDFVLIDARSIQRDWESIAVKMCDRHFGIGADGILLLLPSSKAHARMRIINADGSEAEMCGNGVRCFTKYILDRGIIGKDVPLTVETLAGIHPIAVTWHSDKVATVKVGMGAPRFKPEEIPVSVSEKLERVVDYPIKADGSSFNITGISMGNPHAVAFIKEPVDSFDLAGVGPTVEHLELFPRRVNFEIVNLIDKNNVKARVWERGAGLTMACGSGAAAIAVAGRLHGFTGDSLNVQLPGGSLKLDWDGKGEVWLTGPAEEVFTGEWPE